MPLSLTPELVALSVDRFMRYVPQEKTGGCLIWEGGLERGGYGSFNLYLPDTELPERKHRFFAARAHRVAYVLFVGPIPEGCEIDHVKAKGCVSRACINPEHLEAVTHRENVFRSDGLGVQHSRKTHCPKGHEYTPENTYTTPGDLSKNRIHRICRTCKSEYYHSRRKKNK